ncbi:conserved protein of unknown function [Streptomyces sp. KY75]|nr:conserved protein of unknown function [Streptomyces sp. KY75]
MKDHRKTLRKISASPVDRYIRVSSRLPSSPLTEPVDPWQGQATHGIRTASPQCDDPTAARSGGRKSLQGLAGAEDWGGACTGVRAPGRHTVGNPTPARYSPLT